MELKELDKQIKENSIGRLYFFYGEEQFLLEHKIKAMRSKLLMPDFQDLNYTVIDDKKQALSELSTELMSVPVMDEKKMIVVKSSGLFSNQKLTDYKTVCELISDIPEYMCVVFWEKEVEKKKEKNLDPISKYGEVLRFDPLSFVQLERWLDRLFSDNGKSILPREINTMIKFSGTGMASLYNEAQKLINFVGDRTKITEEDVVKVVSKSTETRIFDVIDEISKGQSKKAFDEIAALRASGESASTILSLLSSRMGELLMVKQLSGEKLSRDKIAGYFEPRRPTFVVDKLLEKAKNFSTKHLRDMTVLGTEYMYLVRTGKLDEWAAVEMYTATLMDNANKK